MVVLGVHEASVGAHNKRHPPSDEEAVPTVFVIALVMLASYFLISPVSGESWSLCLVSLFLCCVSEPEPYVIKQCQSIHPVENVLTCF